MATNPKQRNKSELVVQKVADETVIYDLRRDEGHGLNPMATFVWEQCDGQTSPTELSRQVSGQFNVPLDKAEQLTWLTLDRLEKAHLLQGPVTRPGILTQPTTRRQMLKTAGLVGLSLALLPVVKTIVAPTPAQAQSSPPPPPPPPPGENCTYTQGHWKNSPEDWPVEEITIGGVTYSKAELIDILNTPPRGDATYILIHQLIAAILNIANGADDAAVASAIAQADAWLAANPLGSDPSDPARQEGIDLGETLDQYNNGDIGPGHCDD